MAKQSNYTVPKSEAREFQRMVQRANRRIQANLKYIQREDLNSEAVQRALLSDYTDRAAWASEKTVFSRSLKFANEKEYKSYRRHVMQWGDDKKPSRTVEGLKEGYERAIVKALTTAAIDNNIPLENGRLPGNIRSKIKGLTLEQMTHFFQNSDPVDDLEYLPYSEIDFNGVDTEGYIDNVDMIINSLQEVYPNANERRYKKMIAEGIDSRAALKQIFPKATAQQISYYISKNGRIPEEYKAPRKRTKRKKK